MPQRLESLSDFTHAPFTKRISFDAGACAMVSCGSSSESDTSCAASDGENGWGDGEDGEGGRGDGGDGGGDVDGGGGDEGHRCIESNGKGKGAGGGIVAKAIDGGTSFDGSCEDAKDGSMTCVKASIGVGGSSLGSVTTSGKTPVCEP